MAFSSLLAKKARSFLSMLGIVIGILTVASLLSIALTVRNEIEASITSLGSNLIDIVPGDIENGGFAQSFGTSTLTEQDFNDIKEVPGTINETMTMVVSGNITAGEQTLQGGLIYASSPAIEETVNTGLETGRFFTDEEDKDLAKLAVLGSSAAEKLFGSAQQAIGQTLQARSTEFEVVGVLQEIEGLASFGGVDQNSLVIIPIRVGWELTNTQLVSEMLLQAENSDSIDKVKEDIEAVLLENHKGEKDFSVLTQEDLLETVGGILDIVTAMLSAIASISLLVGGIGIMNIMLVSVSERTREIGVRKAVGATQWAILLQFLIESAILTLVAGIIAVGLFSLVVTAIPEDSPIPISLEPTVLVLALTFSAAVGIVFGLIPAIGASRKNPIDALRYE